MKRRGSILAETVLVMPLLLMLIFGIIQFSLIWTAKQMTAYAAFCATRAIMVVPPGTEQRDAAQQAAEVALSWMCMADKGEAPVSIPGWGSISGSGSASKRVRTRIRANGRDTPAAAVEVSFEYPLIIPGMAVNKIIANHRGADNNDETPIDFYEELDDASRDADISIDGFWPHIRLTESCVLPMPYSTVKFPTGGFSGTDIHGGGL